MKNEHFFSALLLLRTVRKHTLWWFAFFIYQTKWCAIEALFSSEYCSILSPTITPFISSKSSASVSAQFLIQSMQNRFRYITLAVWSLLIRKSWNFPAKWKWVDGYHNIFFALWLNIVVKSEKGSFQSQLLQLQFYNFPYDKQSCDMCFSTVGLKSGTLDLIDNVPVESVKLNVSSHRSKKKRLHTKIRFNAGEQTVCLFTLITIWGRSRKNRGDPVELSIAKKKVASLKLCD